MPKRILEAATPEERGKVRRGLGTLRELTVQPSTRKRYDKALQQIFAFLKHEGLDPPTSRARMDLIFCDYLEELWATGKGRAQACDTLAGLQDSQPSLRHHLPGAWRLLRTRKQMRYRLGRLHCLNILFGLWQAGHFSTSGPLSRFPF